MNFKMYFQAKKQSEIKNLTLKTLFSYLKLHTSVVLLSTVTTALLGLHTEFGNNVIRLDADLQEWPKYERNEQFAEDLLVPGDSDAEMSLKWPRA